jgi:uncharacterized protein (TIGR03086 family)
MAGDVTAVDVAEVAERYRRVADGFTARVRGVPDGGWSGQSPCPDWTARDVVAHVTRMHRAVAATLDGTEPPPVDEDGDLPAQWDAARDGIEAALADPGRASRVVGGRFGEQPFASLVGRFVCTDVLVHTWDLARATGQDDSLDQPAARAALAALEPLDDAIRVPGGFGPAVEPPSDADDAVRLLSFCGRVG